MLTKQLLSVTFYDTSAGIGANFQAQGHTHKDGLRWQQDRQMIISNLFCQQFNPSNLQILTVTLSVIKYFYEEHLFLNLKKECLPFKEPTLVAVYSLYKIVYLLIDNTSNSIFFRNIEHAMVSKEICPTSIVLPSFWMHKKGAMLTTSEYLVLKA